MDVATDSLRTATTTLPSGVDHMTHSFFSRTADAAVAIGLAATMLWAVVSIGPVALDRWL
jgi:hypothetical protein